MKDYSRFQHLTVEKKDRVALLTLNRPQVLNAFNDEMHVELEDVLEVLARDEEINALVVTGAGRAFSAGGDIRGMEARAAHARPSPLSLEGARRLVNNLLSIEPPIIAAVNGDAVGLGATVALFCDIVLAAENARIGDPHVRVGLVAGDGGAIIWPLLVGPNKAKEMLLTGDLMSAREAERWGLVNRVLSQEELLPAAMELARRLAAGPQKALRWTKHSINKRLRDEVNQVLDTSLALEWLSMATEDHREAVRSFLEKRAPHFKGT